MTLQPKTVKILAAVGALALLAAIGLFAFLYVAVQNAGPKQPKITAYTHGGAVEVAPLEYCTVTLEDCTDGSIAQVEVRDNEPLQLSLPHDISSAPWRLVMVWEKPNGTLLAQEKYYRKDEALAVTIRSEEKPPLRLNGVEIQLPSALIDENGLQHAHAVWSIKTA